MRLLGSLALVLVVFLPLKSNAELVIEITQGRDNPTVIAVSPLHGKVLDFHLRMWRKLFKIIWRGRVSLRLWPG